MLLIVLSYMLNLNHLYYFYTAAQHRTITQAAKAIGISQPSLTSQIKLLESQIEKRLFRRAGRNVLLTLDGEKLLKLCKPIFDSVADLEKKIHLESHAPSARRLRIGFTEHIEGTFVADVVSNLFTQKDVHFQVSSGRKETLFHQLRHHEIDIAISNTGGNEPDVEVLQHIKMPVGLYIAKKQFKNKTSKNWLDFLRKNEMGLALPGNHVRLRHETNEFLEANGIKNSLIFESDILSLVTRAVIDGAGVGFFPKPYLAMEEEEGRVICLSGKTPLWEHSLFLTTHQHTEKTPLIRQTVSLMKEYFRDFR
jgi:LysR family transcriptional activator of nhaA